MWLTLLLVLILPAPRSCNITIYNDGKTDHLVRHTAQCLSFALDVITINSSEVSVAVPSLSIDVPHEVESLILSTLKTFQSSTKTVVSNFGRNTSAITSMIKHLLAFVSHVVDIPDVVNSYCNGITRKSVIIVLPPKQKISQVELITLNFTRTKTIFFAEPIDDYHRPLVIYNLRNKTTLVDIGFDCKRYEENPTAVSKRMLHLAVDHQMILGINFVPPYTYPKAIVRSMNLGSKPIYYGIELGALTMMGLKLNYSEDHELGVCDYKNGSCVGLLGDLQSDKIDILAGGLETDRYHNLNSIAYSYPLFNDKLVIIVKNYIKDTIADGMQTRILQKEVWMAYSIILVMSAGLSYWVKKQSRRSTSRYSLSGICLAWFGVSVGMPIESFEGFLSLLLVPSLWISFFVRLVYQSHLITMLLQRNVPSSVNYIEDICRQNYTIYCGIFLHNISDSPIRHCQPDRFIYCDNPLKCLNDSFVTVDKKYAAITYLSTYKYERYKYLTPEEGNIFHVVNEVIIGVPISFLLKTGDPIIEHIDMMGKVISANGLFDYVLKIADRLSDKEFLKAKREFGLDANFTALSLKHVKFVFALFICGVSLSVVCFLLEHLWYRTFGYKKRIN